MKTPTKTLLATGIAAVVALSSIAADVRLAWDAPATIGVTNYVLYAQTNHSLSQTNHTNAVLKLRVGTNLTAMAENITPGKWSFAVTATKDNIESDLSNILLVEVPAPPQSMRTIAIQFGVTLTNFTDVGFFRLRIPSP